MLSAISPALRFTLTWVWLMAATMCNLMWLCSEHEGGRGDPAVRSFFSGHLREIWTTINDAPVQLTQTRLLFFSSGPPRCAVSLSGAWSRLSLQKCCFPKWQKILRSTSCCGGAAFNTQSNPAGNSSTKQFLKKEKEKKREVSLSSKTPRKVCAEPTLSFCILSTFMSFSLCFSHLLFSLLIITKTKPFPSL